MTEISTKTYKLQVTSEHTITVRVDSPPPGCVTHKPPKVLILAHGASNNLDFPLLVTVAHHLASFGVATVVRFNFPYAEKGLQSPDRKELLEATYLAVYRHVADSVATNETVIFVGGKSLGGRTAAELVSRGQEQDGVQAAGLVELGYPLHRPGQKDHLFLEPLRNISIPSLFFVGTRDPLCDPVLLEPVVASLAHPGKIYVVRDGDHSFRLPASSNQQPEAAYPEIAAETVRFIEEITREKLE